MTQRVLRVVPVGLVAVSLLTAGCGQRLDTSTRRTLLDGSLGRGQAAVTAPDQQGLQATTAPGAQVPGQGGPQATTGGAGGTGSSGTQAGPKVGVSAPPGGNGGATDVAVTPTSITVGTVADETGAQPGLFDGDVAGVRAYFAYVNSQGGVYGRTLRTTVADSAIDCNGTTNAYNALVDKVFAFVGNLSVYDNCGVPVLKAHPKVPDVSYQLTAEHANNPSTWSVQPSVPGQRVGPIRAFTKAFPETKGAVGALVSDIPAARSNWSTEKQMLLSLGYTVVYEQYPAATEIDYTRYVIGMRQANVKMALLFTSAPNIEKFINSAQSQGFTPPVIDAPSTMYDATMAKAIGDAPTNVYSDQTLALYFNADEGKRIPGVALYQKWMAKTAPDQQLDAFSVFGWTEAMLFVQALKAAGPKATRASLMTALRATHTVDTGGLMSPGDPGRRGPVKCWLIAHYVKGTFERWHSPADGFDCRDPYFFAK